MRSAISSLAEAKEGVLQRFSFAMRANKFIQDRAKPIPWVMDQEMRENAIKEIRESLMVSKIELAKMANISPNTITRIEQGLPCRIETKRKIITALEHNYAYGNKVRTIFLIDNGGRRLGLDQRQFSYDKHIPERRSGKERRNRLDRKLKS